MSLATAQPAVAFIDLRTQYQQLQEDIQQRMHAVLEHGRYVMGPEMFELEERLSAFVGVGHCISASSGTDALLMAMLALGIGPGDEVITPAFSFVAVAEMVALLGAKPVFIDVDPQGYHLDPSQLESLITPKTKLIIPVSLYGQCVDFDAISAIAEKHNIPVVEDAAQSLGATYRGKPSCSVTTISCTSFYPSKPLGCYGDGGACFTNDATLAEAMRAIRDHGQKGRYAHHSVGITGRLDTLQAAILLSKLDVFPDEIIQRQRVAEQYNRLLKGVLQTPRLHPHNTSVYAQYTVQDKSW